MGRVSSLCTPGWEPAPPSAKLCGLEPQGMTQPPRLSVITAIHNALPMNRFYWEVLSRQTRVPFELIVIDNHSTDGSRELFAALARFPLPCGQRVVQVRNERNQSYPASQNQGIRHAQADGGTTCPSREAASFKRRASSPQALEPDSRLLVRGGL